MEILAEGMMALGKAVGSIASAIATIYVVGFGTKTFLIYTGRATVDQTKDWFNLGLRKEYRKL